MLFTIQSLFYKLWSQQTWFNNKDMETWRRKSFTNNCQKNPAYMKTTILKLMNSFKLAFLGFFKTSKAFEYIAWSSIKSVQVTPSVSAVD